MIEARRVRYWRVEAMEDGRVVESETCRGRESADARLYAWRLLARRGEGRHAGRSVRLRYAGSEIRYVCPECRRDYEAAEAAARCAEIDREPDFEVSAAQAQAMSYVASYEGRLY